MSDSGADFGAFVSGFVLGGLVGAAVALLMAPQSGEETRAQIRDKSIELRDSANDEIKKFRSNAEAALEDIRAQAEDLQHRVTDAIEQGIQGAQEARDEGAAG
ncbi:MAG: YtxH domain-containing protein [Chloroflexi bacterium]|nr:YtxH domain-containing protein [Chloroflexota bacterium]